MHVLVDFIFSTTSNTAPQVFTTGWRVLVTVRCTRQSPVWAGTHSTRTSIRAWRCTFYMTLGVTFTGKHSASCSLVIISQSERIISVTWLVTGNQPITDQYILTPIHFLIRCLYFLPLFIFFFLPHSPAFTRIHSTISLLTPGYIRDEMKFESLDALIERINLDIKEGSEALDCHLHFSDDPFFKSPV